MNYQDFQKKIAEEVRFYLPAHYADATILVTPIPKNNGVVLDGLQIMLPGENITPCIYLNEYYEQYQQGRGLEGIMKEISQVRMESRLPGNEELSSIMDFDKIKDKIIFEVVNMENNRNRLRTVPYHAENDLALIYRILLNQDSHGSMSVLISDTFLQEWEIKKEELHELAMANTQKKFPAVFCPLEEVMKEMMIQDFMEHSPGATVDEAKAFWDEMVSMDMQSHGPSMYVLSNEEKMNGASSLFYPNMRDVIAEQLGANYYVLPSSMHEVLILPDDGTLSPQELKEMVMHVNQTEVPPEDFLSESVYFFDRKTHQLSVAGEEKPSLSSQIENARAKRSVSSPDSLKEKGQEKLPGSER